MPKESAQNFATKDLRAGTGMDNSGQSGSLAGRVALLLEKMQKDRNYPFAMLTWSVLTTVSTERKKKRHGKPNRKRN